MARQPLSPSEARREHEMLRELRRFHRENDCGGADAPTVTQLAKKRLRMPTVDVDVNPFCMDRQLADEYELMNLNKNPRFYAAALEKPSIVRENPRNYSSFVNQVADRIASSGVSPRARAEFSTKRPAPSYAPPVAQFSTPTVFTVDPSNLRRDLKAEGNTSTTLPLPLPPAHEQYGVHLTKRTVTFGHRPGSGGRMYDRLTDSITGPGGVKAIASPSPSSSRSSDSVSSRRSSALSTPIKTGMSVMALAQLLAPPKASDRSPSSSGGGSKSMQFDDESDDEDDNEDDVDLDEDAHQRRRRRRARREQRRKQKELQELERKYQNAVFNPKRERRGPQFLPPTDQSTAQLIDKYRKLAVGKLPGANDGE